MSQAPKPMSPVEWKAHLAADPKTPTDEVSIRALIARLTGKAPPDPALPSKVASRIINSCLSEEAWRVDQALRNPHLDPSLRQRLFDELHPGVANTVIDRPHFTITYTDGQGVGQVPTATATNAADDLETAYTVYLNYYGTAIVPASQKCPVTFAEGVNWTKPDGSMQLSCGMFKTYGLNPEARRLTCFHEAYHLLQFISGFTVAGNAWFLEGTATWAEVVHGSDPAKPAVTSAAKLTSYWTNQLTPILDAVYTTLPFFINLDAVCTSSSEPSGQVMKDIITTFKASYPTPGSTSVPDQIVACASAYVTLGVTLTIESLWVNWLAKMAQGNWNVTQSNVRIYSTIYDADNRNLPAIVIPALTVPAERGMVLSDPNNTWDSEGTVPTSEPYIGQIQFQLKPIYPPAGFTADVYPMSFVGNMVEPLSVFEYGAGNPDSGTGPDVVPAEVCDRVYHDPQSANVYIVFVGEYNYAVQYHFKARLLGNP